MRQLSPKLWDKIQALSTTLEEIVNDLDGAASKAENYRDDRSETWQESDKGEEYSSWCEQIRTTQEATEALREAIEELPQSPNE